MCAHDGKQRQGFGAPYLLYQCFSGDCGEAFGLPCNAFFYLNIVTAMSSLYYFHYQSKARKFSREIGFKYIVLLPVHRLWAMILINISGGKIKDKFNRAFEVHINASPGLSLEQYLKVIDADLNLAICKLSGSLFFWETTAPIPSSIRKLIRNKAKEDNAFWKEGGWLIPRFSTVSNMKKGVLRRGAIMILESRDIYE